LRSGGTNIVALGPAIWKARFPANATHAT